MSVITELKNAVDDVYSLELAKTQLRLLGIPQDYTFEELDEEINRVLNDEELKTDLINVASVLFNFFSYPYLDDLTIVEDILEKYSDKIKT